MKPDKASSSVWLIFGIAVVYGSYKLGPGTLRHPGPGFLTFWSGIIFCFLSGLVFLRGRTASEEEETKTVKQLWAGLNWSKAVVVALAIFLYALTFTYLGFLFSTTLLLIFLLRAIEPGRWRMAIIGSVLASLASFIVFDLWLLVQLPHSFLENFLFHLKRILF
jgi:putative tricarboxylic transport membrane protein